jgi:hypothetical protein
MSAPSCARRRLIQNVRQIINMPSKKGLHSDETYQLLAEKDIVVLNAQYYLRKSLIKWSIRSVIGLFLFGFLTCKYSWGIWILITWGVIALASLAVIIFAALQISRRSKKFENVVQSNRPDEYPE